jgi:mRNA interferase RelE/StbE
MVYDVQWTITAERQFSKLDKSTKKRIIDKIDSIQDNPFLYVTRLVGFNAYKLRVGNYRIILGIEKKNLVILILKVGHRKNIY